jgi:hypothetical protein
MAGRVTHYSTTLPLGRPAGRRTVASLVSLALHLAVFALLIRQAVRMEQQADRPAAQPEERPIQLVFAPPRPRPTPRPQTPPVPPAPQAPPTAPAVPLTPGPDPTPGSRARVSDTPEPEPNAPPETARSEATRPDPGSETSTSGTAERTQPPAAIAAQPRAATNTPTLESEAQRLFGRPSSKLGPVSGQRDNRPWESPVQLSNGCTLPPEEEADSTVPKGMAVVVGKIYREGTNEPLSGARLQILGTQYGTFSNGRGEYRLVFDRTLVDRCRTQSVRVSAPGYAARDVILYVGERLSSDVPLRRY